MIIYQIFVDRFNGNFNDQFHLPEFAGGTLKGITEKIDYLKELGVTCLWLTPFYKTTAYHGYHITDFTSIDRHFGTLDDLRQLLKTAKEKELKVIADFVPNHCSKHHPYFVEAYTNEKSKYRDWFYFGKKNKYLSFLNYDELPKIRLDNPDAYQYVLESAKYWLSLGFDGFRLDHVIGPTFHFWKQFSTDIKKDFPQALLIGEAWAEGMSKKFYKTVHLKRKTLKYFTGIEQDALQLDYYGYLDAMLDFKFNELVKLHFKKHNHPTKKFEKQVQKHFEKYPKDFLPIIFLDNHDMNRFLFTCKQNKQRLLNAFEFMLQQGFPVVIYYGTETGLTHEKPLNEYYSHGDLQCRIPMPWEKLDKEFVEKFKQIIAENVK